MGRRGVKKGFYTIGSKKEVALLDKKLTHGTMDCCGVVPRETEIGLEFAFVDSEPQASRSIAMKSIPVLVLAAACLLGRPVTAEGPRFDYFTEPRLPAGEEPHGFTAADLDGDGIIDLAGAKVSTVYSLHGEEGGFFEDSVSYPVPGWSEWLSPGDFDGDGSLDLASLCSLGLTILFNREGRFRILPEITLFVRGDANGDDSVDLSDAMKDYRLPLPGRRRPPLPRRRRRERRRRDRHR
jgi:hypothetical protein